MNRTEVYSLIKAYELQNAIKELYGYNYTNLSTATLVDFVTKYEASLEDEKCECECKLTSLINLLYKKHLICKSEYETLMS